MSRATTWPWTERMDPYWDQVWTTSNAAWSSRVTVEAYVDGGYMRAPKWLSRSTDEALDALATGHRSQMRRDGLATVNMFRVLTAEQLACITGSPEWAAHQSEDRGVLYASGLVEVGKVVGVLPTRMPELLRTKVASKAKVLRSRLTREQMIQVTSGGNWSSSMSTDRHALLATEFLLRTAEELNVPLVMGEAVARMSLLTPLVPAGSLRAADGVIVRGDGMVIAVEVISSLSSSLHTKLDLWCDVISRDPNVRVLFLVASHPAGWNATKELKKKLWKAVVGTGVSAQRVAERVSVAEWKDWFPRRGELSPSFMTLRSFSPTGEPGSRWEPMHLLNEFGVGFNGSSRVLDAGKYLRSIPCWQR